MLKGWNRKVRITSAINSAWMTTRTVSPKPLSVFVPDVTLIAFPVPGFPNSRRENSARWQNLFLTRQAARFRVEKMVLILIVRANSGANPNSLLSRSLRRFRRLFTAAQSTAALKHANPLTSRRFLVLRQAAILAAEARHGLPGWTAEIMTKA
jgi:hypothetical protein